MTVTVHAADVVLTMTGEPLPGHAVVVENAVIAAIGPRSDFTHERIRDWPGVLLPGLVNAHTRLRFDDRVAAHQLLRNGTTTAGWVETLSGDDVDLLASCPGGDAEARIRAITVEAAQALGLDVGTLRVGGRADLAVFDVPPLDPYVSLITHGAGRCVATVMGGRLVHRR